MEFVKRLLIASVFLVSSINPAFAQHAGPQESRLTSQADLGIDSSTYRREFRDSRDPSKAVIYSTASLQSMLADLEHMDQVARRNLNRESAIDLVERLSTAIDLYILVLQDQRIPGESKINITAPMEGGMYQAFLSVLRHYGADPVDPKTREIPKRGFLRKIVQEMGVDVRSFVSSPFEKLYRDQATQFLLGKLQDLARQAHTVNDGDKGLIAENSRDMMKEIVVEKSVQTVNDRRAAQWFTAGTYGLLSIVSFFVIIDYVGIIDGMLGGVGRTEMSQLITGIINFSILFSAAALKAASIRGHVRKMVLDMQKILTDPASQASNTPMRRALATWMFRKQIDFDRELTARGVRPQGGGALRCSMIHL